MANAPKMDPFELMANDLEIAQKDRFQESEISYGFFSSPVELEVLNHIADLRFRIGRRRRIGRTNYNQFVSDED